MTVTRFNYFEARPDAGDELQTILTAMLPAMKSAAGFHSYEILRSVDIPEKIVVIEVWDSIEAHQSAARNIAPENFQKVMAVIAARPTGGYYASVA